jgi:hypothetical protein
LICARFSYCGVGAGTLKPFQRSTFKSMNVPRDKCQSPVRIADAD